MDFFEKLRNFLVAFLSALFVPIIALFPSYNDYTVEIDMSQEEGILPNAVSNINIWNMNSSDEFSNLKINEKYNIGEFVEYVQLMQCTGGSVDRDLFVDPLDFETLDDYDFSSLIANCRGILQLGAKPHLKTGSVPLKYSALARTDTTFGTNPYPPDDYNVYYDYIYAIGEALVAEFGKNEVLTWRFGVMTEYENKDWFFAPDETPESSAAAYCKLYDYTVDALQKSIGEEVFVGAHSMTVTEGLWDEKIFIEHCASGTNYKTGKTGSRICFLSASFYDIKPGEFTSGKRMDESIAYLQQCADEAGLKNLIFGIDEGRIYSGINSGAVDSQLLSRTVGYTYQAAYDARLYKQLFDIGGDYLSSWYYLSGGLFKGNPTVSYHVASNIAKFGNSSRVQSEFTRKGVLPCPEVDCISAFDKNNDTLRIMAYNFRNKLNYEWDADISFNIHTPQFDGKDVTVTVYSIDDNCNFFDEWVKDRETYGIGNDCFAWSPDDAVLESDSVLNNREANEFYFNNLRDKYEEYSRLEGTTYTAKVIDSKLSLTQNIAPNGVVFVEITPVN